MSLVDEIAKRKAQERADAAHRANPELEARLDQFIVKSTVLDARYHAIGKDELIRKLMLSKMERAEVAVRRNRELAQWVNENPDIIAKVEQRIKNRATENRQRVGVSVAKAAELVSEGRRPPSLRQ